MKKVKNKKKKVMQNFSLKDKQVVLKHLELNMLFPLVLEFQSCGIYKFVIQPFFESVFQRRVLLHCLSGVFTWVELFPPLVRGMGLRRTGHQCGLCFLVAFQASSESQRKYGHSGISGPELQDHAPPTPLQQALQIKPSPPPP